MARTTRSTRMYGSRAELYFSLRSFSAFPFESLIAEQHATPSGAGLSAEVMLPSCAVSWRVVQRTLLGYLTRRARCSLGVAVGLSMACLFPQPSTAASSN